MDGLPPLDELNTIPAEAFIAATGPLFEGAPRFLSRLAAARPFSSEAELLAEARTIARQMTEDEQRELLDAHPRIGADPATVSVLSHAEQGYVDGDPDVPTEGASDAWVGEELDMLNELYEARFGFRFVVFVAGRARRDIIPLLERAMHADREAELRRGLDDAIDVAGDRLRTLRGGSDGDDTG